MKPDDKFPEEMLDDIRVAAIKARDALDGLDFALGELGRIYPTFRPARVAMWKAGVADMVRKSNAIANMAEEFAAEDKTAAGRKEQTCAKCRSFLARDLACALYGEPCGDYDACSGFSPKDGMEAGNGNTKHETKNTKQQEGETQE